MAVNGNDKMRMAHLLSHQRSATQADEDLSIQNMSYIESAKKYKSIVDDPHETSELSHNIKLKAYSIDGS